NRDVGRRRVRIECKSTLRSGLAPRKRILERIESIGRENELGNGQRAPRLRITDVKVYRLLKRIPCLEQSRPPGGKQSQSAQIKFMRFRVVRAVNDKWLPGAARELHAQFGCDRFGNFIFDRKDVVEFAVVL